MEINYYIVGTVVIIAIVVVIVVNRRNQKEKHKLEQKLNDDYYKDAELDSDVNDKTAL